jgi:uncharacterized protein YcgI (DUF1989 family)
VKILKEVTIPSNSGKSFIVMKGNCICVIGESIADFVVFNFENLKERFDQARTKANQGKIYLSTGDVLYSKLNNIMMTIIEDTYAGKHDLQYGTCSKTSYDLWWKKLRNTDAFRDDFAAWGVKSREDLPDHGCLENIADALNDYDIIPEDIPSPFNLFQSIEIDKQGKFLWRIDDYRPEPGKPATATLRAEMNCLVAVSACPEMGKRTARPVKIQLRVK